MSILDNFNQFKEFLNQRVDQAQQAGLNNETIENLAQKIGDYLAQNVEPQNGQERLLKELWQAGNPEEQRMLAGLMLKEVDHQ